MRKIIQCTNPRCRELCERKRPLLVCPSCELALHLGVTAGAVLTGVLGLLWGLLS